LNVGLYNDQGQIHIISDVVISDKAENTIIDLNGIPVDFGDVKAIYVNEGEHAYAKVRFDSNSTDWFTQNLHLVEDSLTRGTIWRYF